MPAFFARNMAPVITVVPVRPAMVPLARGFSAYLRSGVLLAFRICQLNPAIVSQAGVTFNTP